MVPIRTTQTEVAADLINLAIGHPSPANLPLAIMRQAASHRMDKGDVSLLQYGNEQGDGYFRIALANFLSRRYGSSVESENLFVSNGVSQALSLICTLFTRPGQVVFVEEPTYYLALRIFADHHLEVVGLPTDNQGLIVEALEEQVALRHPVLLYTIPTHQNPSGSTLPLERRQRLLELSLKQNFLIVADEVYHLLSYSSAPPPPLGSFIAEASVFSLGSFSKILAPGLRLGWVQAAPQLVKGLTQSGMLDSGGGLNPFTSGLVRSVLELGLQDQHLEHISKLYARRLAAMSSALKTLLPGAISFQDPLGGYFFWLSLPQGSDAQSLLAKARQQKVNFTPGIRFSSRKGMLDRLRLSFSYYNEDSIEEGIKRLAAALRSSAIE